jgi:LysM repeat protein
VETTTTPTRSGARRPVVAATTLLLTGAAALAVALLLAWWSLDQVTSTRLWRVESFVGPGVVTAGAAAAAWVGASALTAAVCALARATGGVWASGERVVQRWAPGLVRRSLALAVAAGVGLGAATGAHATTDAAPPAAAVTTVVDLGWAPTDAPGPVGAPSRTHDATQGRTPSPPAPAEPADADDASPAHGRTATHDDADEVRSDAPAAVAGSARDAAPSATEASDGPSGASPGDPTTLTTFEHDTEGTVVVAVGDSLWAVAARQLGPGATDAQIAAEWPRWYRANEATIGPDPDVLRPGQVLRAPGPLEGAAR